MHVVVQMMILCIATYWVATYGIARTFAQIYFPAILFFFLIPKFDLPMIPDLTASSAIGYPILFLAASKWDEVRRVRWGAFDGLVALMMIVPAFSMLTTADTLWDAAGRSGDFFFVWIVPYFMARVAMHDAEARRLMLKTICVCTIIIGCLAAIEARLRPYMISRALEKLNLNSALYGNDEVFTRFGLMRAQTSLGHPIDLGNCGVILGGMIIMLVPIVGKKYTDKLVLAAIFSCGAMVIGSVSFTGIFAMSSAFVMLLLFTRPTIGKYMVLPAVMALAIFLVSYQAHMINKELPEDRPENPAEASQWARDVVAQTAWPVAQNAGLLGLGQKIDTKSLNIGTGGGSVDNSYLLFIMQYGWVYFVLWIVMALVIGFKGNMTLQLASTPTARIPVAAVLAAIIATFEAMFTVWYGFVYSILLVVLFGCFATMSQILSQQASIPYATPAPHMQRPPMRAPVRA